MPGVRTFNVWLDGQKAHLLQQTRKRQMRRARRKSVEATSTIMVAVWPIPISPPAKYCQMTQDMVPHFKSKVYLCIPQHCRPWSPPDPDTQLLRALVLEQPPWFSSSFHRCKSRCILPKASTHQPCSQLEIYFSEIFKMIVLNIQYGFWSWRFEYNGDGDVVSRIFPFFKIVLRLPLAAKTAARFASTTA